MDYAWSSPPRRSKTRAFAADFAGDLEFGFRVRKASLLFMSDEKVKEEEVEEEEKPVCAFFVKLILFF